MSWSMRNGELSRDREPTEWEEWCDIHNDSDTCFRLKESFEKEIERNPIDFKMEIEQVFEPEDCTMVMEDYGKCQDYPCDDCVTRFLKNYKEK
jgi:hypothetical protein